MKRLLIAGFALGSAACRAGPEHHVPKTALAAHWAEAGAASTEEPAREWWRGFGDPALDAIVERALDQNLDVQIAAARIREARALRAAVAGQWAPQVDGSLSAARSSPSGTTPAARGSGTTNVFDAGFDARFEIDLFGLRARALEAADAATGAVIESRHDVIVSVLAEIARNYVELRGAERQIEILRANLALQRETVELTRRRFRAGMSTDLDVARAESQAATTEAEIPLFEARARAGRHALSVLAGEPPGGVATELVSPAPVPEAPPAVAAGLPSELLRRRPDIRAAERELARATAETGEAVARLYPSFSLGATLTRQAPTFPELFDGASSAWSVGAGLVAPFADGGTRRARVHASEARAEAARLAYRRTVLEAVAEVESALATVARERERRAALEQALAADRRAVALADDLYARGIVSFFEVLGAQQSVLRSEAALAASRTDLATRTVALYKALGGGWEVAGE